MKGSIPGVITVHRWSSSRSSGKARLGSARKQRETGSQVSSKPGAVQVVTDREAARYRNMSFVLLDMHAPGVEVRPLRQVTGASEFNELFLDDVEIPLENVVGGLGNGWAVAMSTLSNERLTYGFLKAAALEVTLSRVTALAKDRGAGVQTRDRLAQSCVELKALKMTNLRILAEMQQSGEPGPLGSLSKLHWSESNQRLNKLALELLGPDAMLLDESDAWYHDFWRSRGNTIEGGTSEILRNSIAERVLSLPRSR